MLTSEFHLKSTINSFSKGGGRVWQKESSVIGVGGKGGGFKNPNLHDVIQEQPITVTCKDRKYKTY